MAQRELRYRTYKFLLHPTKLQIQSLNRQLNLQCELYNAALEERIGVWKVEHRSIGLYEQCQEVKGLKEVRPDVVASGVDLCRGTLQRLDRAYGAFYRRLKLGEAPGFPRFKSAKRFDSLEWGDSNG